MRIRDIFRNDITRRIEEVVKVDVSDDEIVAEEISEYVVTPRIEESFHDVIEVYRESIGNPSGLTNLWVSGFFGSGKSSFAKVLGYLFENRAVGERRSADLFFARCNDKRIAALLERSWELAPTVTVFLELSSSQDVTDESEGIVLPMYRALLARFDYAQTPKLATLEFDLERDGRLDDFEDAFKRANDRDWKASRDTALALNMASKALHELDPATFPAADSWSSAFEAPALTARWFTRRAVDLLALRGGGASRLVFVVDEVSQYIARSIDRIRALQGLAERFQELGGRLWLVATGQERLEEVVEGLEGRQTELQRLRDRFPLTVDLLPSDIHEVVSRRILDKHDEGRAEIAGLLAGHRQKLAANTRLVSETRAGDPSEDDLVRLYSLLPYQVQLLIDAVSKRRSQVRSSAPMGGSNRTVIKHAQQLVTSSKVGLGDNEVGALVTIDRSYDLLEEVIPTSWRGEIDQVIAKYGKPSVEVQVMKAIALVHDVPSLPLTAHNLAVLLHPAIDAESRRDEITAALGRLVADDRIRETDRGFQLQSVEQKQWDQERREIALGLGDELRLRKRLLSKSLSGLTVNLGRAFAIGLTVDREQRVPGDVTLEVVEQTHADHADELRALSRESTSANRVFWLFDQSEDTWQALEELHKSDRMIERHDVPSKSTADVQLLADEKNRQARAERQALQSLGADLEKGQILFAGRAEPAPTGEIRAAAQALVRDRLPEIYPKLDRFAAPVDARDVMLVLRADDLDTLPDSLQDGGIGLVTITPTGPQLAVDREPLSDFIAEVRHRSSYGQVPTGQVLERHFANPPFGAPVAVVQALTAAAVRAGLLEVVHQGQTIRSAGDRRLDAVFRTLPAFRQAEIRPAQDTGPDAPTRARLARQLQDHTGETQSPHLEELAARLRLLAANRAAQVTEVAATLRGAGLVVPPAVARAKELVGRLRGDDDVEVVTTAAGGWEDLMVGLAAAEALGARLDSDLDVLTGARNEAAAPTEHLGDEAEAARMRLADLLAAGDYVSHAGEITSLADQLCTARRECTEQLRAQLTAALEQIRAELAQDFEAVGETERAGAMRPVTDLSPSAEASIDTLHARLGQLDVARSQARHALESLRSAGRLVEVHVTSVVDHSIANEADLDAALGAIRAEVVAALVDGKEVRLR
jgi:hypothetical protein